MESKIRDRLDQEFDRAIVEVRVEGNRAAIRVVSEAFVGVPRVKRQQRVYGCLTDFIQKGELHAVTIESKSPQEV